MKYLLFVLSILAFLAGMAILVAAKSAIHEIQTFILFLISAVFFSGAGIVEAVNQLKKELERGKE